MCECRRKLGTNRLTTGKSQQMEVSEPMTELVSRCKMHIHFVYVCSAKELSAKISPNYFE